VTIVSYFPLESGLLTGKFHKDPSLLAKKPIAWRARVKNQLEASRPLINALERFAASYGVTTAQVALNWVINSHGEGVVTIPGATKAYQAEQNAAAMQFTLTKDELAELDELSKAFR
jgi:aryl-alcohol dehydrogenase-like predicted oxidoreductase